MATFTSSRLGNLREKKNSALQLPQQAQINSNFKLTMPSQPQKSQYEPTSTFNNTRTSMRLLKGRIEKKQSTNDNKIGMGSIGSSDVGGFGKNTGSAGFGDSRQMDSGFPKLTLSDNKEKEDFKLIIHDSPQIQSRKSVADQPQSKPSEKKRILISRDPPKDQLPQSKPSITTNNPPPPPQRQIPIVNKVQQLPVGKQIKQQQVQESNEQPLNQNDLVQCPEGCGRKFNRKALQKHAKACKVVFMSKRKEFNSEAKRVTSQQQAQIVKQNKLKEKKEMGKTKGKGFQKTGDNWKVASEDFRAALKAIKKEEDMNEGQKGQEQQEKVEKTVTCQNCEKIFNELFIEQHLEHCPKKKDKERKSIAKKKK